MIINSATKHSQHTTCSAVFFVRVPGFTHLVTNTLLLTTRKSVKITEHIRTVHGAVTHDLSDKSGDCMLTQSR